MPSASNFVSNQRLSNISAPRPNFGSGLSQNYVEENAQHPTGDVLKVSLLRYQFFCIPGSIVLNWPNVFWQNL